MFPPDNETETRQHLRGGQPWLSSGYPILISLDSSRYYSEPGGANGGRASSIMYERPAGFTLFIFNHTVRAFLTTPRIPLSMVMASEKFL
jgi:hypothetical protein